MFVGCVCVCVCVYLLFTEETKEQKDCVQGHMASQYM